MHKIGFAMSGAFNCLGLTGRFNLDKLSSVLERRHLLSSSAPVQAFTFLSSPFPKTYATSCSYNPLNASSIFINQFSPISKPRVYAYSPSRQVHASGGNNNIQGKEVILPPLMPFPVIVWPKFINALRNWFFIHFIIKPYFDKEFSMNEFLLGAKEAVSVVSNKLSEGKIDELEGLVDASALSQIRGSLSKFTVFQQQLLRVASEDIFFAFPYQVGIIIPDETPQAQSDGAARTPQTRHVEITVCCHVLRGLAEKQRSGETGATFSFQEFTQDERNKYNVMICNYRFFKDFTEGSPDPSWIINMVNHFLPADLQQNQ